MFSAPVVEDNTSLEKFVEANKLLKLHNDNDIDFEFKGTAAQFFEKKVKTSPHKPFIVLHKTNKQTEVYSYLEIENKANQLANLFKENGIHSQSVVGVSLDRSVNLITTLFALWKLNAIYFPINDKPEEKFDEMIIRKIQTANPSHIIMENATQHLFQQQKLFFINLDQFCLENYPKKFKSPFINPLSYAYIMFTSGTAGMTKVPKGIKISHQAVNNLMNNLHQQFGTDLNVLMMSSIAFDACLVEQLVALNENTLHITSYIDRFSADKIKKIIKQYHINYLAVTPEMAKDLEECAIQHFTVMGAMPDEKFVQRWRQKHPTCIVYNGYGPSECTGASTITPFKSAHFLGLPLKNMKMYVLNPKTLKICLPNEEGEIVESGLGVAQEGYINNPELSKDKFIHAHYDDKTFSFVPIENPTNNSVLLYATGDLGFYDEQGFYIKGRKDNHIKLEGNQIDLDKIQETLLKYSDLKSAVVLIHDQPVRINAYLVPKNENQILPFEELISEIKRWLPHQGLPDCAIPRAYFILSSFQPFLTTNGKVNVKLLKEATFPIYKITGSQTKNNLQNKLQQWWSEVLMIPCEQIDLNLSFKYHGGTSKDYGKLLTLFKLKLKLTNDEIKLFHKNNLTILEMEKMINNIEALRFKIKEIWSAILNKPLDKNDYKISLEKQGGNDKDFNKLLLKLKYSFKLSQQQILLLNKKGYQHLNIIELASYIKSNSATPLNFFNPPDIKNHNQRVRDGSLKYQF